MTITEARRLAVRYSQATAARAAIQIRGHDSKTSSQAWAKQLSSRTTIKVGAIPKRMDKVGSRRSQCLATSDRTTAPLTKARNVSQTTLAQTIAAINSVKWIRTSFSCRDPSETIHKIVSVEACKTCHSRKAKWVNCL